jgi:predicted dehydrogenase
VNLPFFYDPLPLAARITHVCTRRRETAQIGAALVGAAHAVTDFREVTENPEVDIVHICTPNQAHKDALLSALRHQKHIYCDKPITATLDEAREVEAALKDYRGTAQMTFQNRFYPATMRARQLVEEGFLGEVLEYRSVYLHSGSADPAAPMKWKLSGAAGGGVIADLASHSLDLMHHLVGDFRELLAATKIAYADRPSAEDPKRRVPVDAEDAVVVLARHASGALGTIEASKIATGAEDDHRFEIHGTRGALRFSSLDPNHLEAYDASRPDKPIGGSRGWTRIDTFGKYPPPASGFPSPKNSIGWIRGHLACLANFLQDVATGRPGNPGLAQGIYVQKLMERAREYVKANAWVKV